MPEAQRWGQSLGIINQFYLIFIYFLRAVHEQDEFNPALFSKAKAVLEYISSTASPGFLNYRKYSNCSTYFNRQLQSHFWFWTRQSLQRSGQNQNRLCRSKTFPGRFFLMLKKFPILPIVCLMTLWTTAHQGPSVHGTFQARTLEWAAISSSRESSPMSPALQVDTLPAEPSRKPLYIAKIISK